MALNSVNHTVLASSLLFRRRTGGLPGELPLGYIWSCRCFLVLIPSTHIFSWVRNSPLSGLMLWTLWMIQMNIISIWQRESEKSRSEETHISKTVAQNKYQKLVHAPYNLKTNALCHVISKRMSCAMSFRNSCVAPCHFKTHVLCQVTTKLIYYNIVSS